MPWANPSTGPAGAAGPTGPSGPQGPQGNPGISGPNAQAELFTLNGATSAGATTVTLNRTSSAPWSAIGGAYWVVVEPGTQLCEIRRFHGISTTTLTLDQQLWQAHSNGAAVWFWAAEHFPFSLWGAVGDGATDDTAAIQAAIDQSGLYGDTDAGLWVSGLGRTYKITYPLVHTDGARVERMQATCSGVTADTNGGTWLSSNHNFVDCTVAAATDTFTVVRATTSAPAAGDKICFQDPTGAGLPAPLAAGLVYFVKTWSGTGPGATFTVSATSGGATLNITADGACRAYQKVNGLSRPYLYDVEIDGNHIAGLNGFRLCIQQPFEARKIRAQNFPGTGLIVGDTVTAQSAQQGEFYNVELLSNGTGAAIYGEGGDFYYLDCESNTLGADISGPNWGIFGFHGETNTQDLKIGSVSSVRGIVLSRVYLGATGADSSHRPITVDNAAGYSIVEAYFNGLTKSAGNVAIDDVSASRPQQLLYEDFVSVHCDMGFLFQPNATVPWSYLDGIGFCLPKVRASLNFGAIPAGGTVQLTVTVNGATTKGNRVTCAPEDNAATFSGLFWQGQVTATGTVTITVFNPTGSPVTPAICTWDVSVQL